eukprot:TRINITY_DN2350_c0_g1_i1.p1 TRINITY_DN2350_c0_g1~~TRINITY_DN2350_c0_g1_i1.p1  ORF type:complete len:128 (+),score=1.10 TRINITY_DN2350_c0_g1_i1:58-441(+)
MTLKLPLADPFKTNFLLYLFQNQYAVSYGKNIPSDVTVQNQSISLKLNSTLKCFPWHWKTSSNFRLSETSSFYCNSLLQTTVQILEQRWGSQHVTNTRISEITDQKGNISKLKKTVPGLLASLIHLD